MPIKQWQEDQRLVMVEMPHLQDKLLIAESAAKNEAKLKVLKDSLLGLPNPGVKSSEMRKSSNGIANCCSMGRGETFSRFTLTGDSKKKTTPPLGTPDTVRKDGKGVAKMFNWRRWLSQDDVSTECCGDLNNGEKFISVEMENDSLDIKQSAPSETLASDCPCCFLQLDSKRDQILEKDEPAKGERSERQGCGHRVTVFVVILLLFTP